jgi:GTP-binding protein EngB required for normal cell division
LEEVVAEVRGHLLRMTDYLGRGSGADLQARLERLGAAVEGTAGEELRRLERIMTEQGLGQLRPALEALIDRLAVPRFEIALFGRVSAGKSSLLNHLIRQEVLPVAVTPVTAVPIRIGWGEEPGARISLADGPPQTVPLSRLADFAAEENNPGNEKHVAGIEVFLGEPHLAGGVVFVDTPGLGSLATRGAAETLAYLPRCDLGVVLIDSGAAATQEDLTVVEGLLAAGARVLVLLSKADLLSPEDRERTRRYTEGKLSSQVGVAVAVAPGPGV